MPQDPIVSATHEGDKYECHYVALLVEQVVRLQWLVAYLLEKNEKLRQANAAQHEKG